MGAEAARASLAVAAEEAARALHTLSAAPTCVVARHVPAAMRLARWRHLLERGGAPDRRRARRPCAKSHLPTVKRPSSGAPGGSPTSRGCRAAWPPARNSREPVRVLAKRVTAAHACRDLGRRGHEVVKSWTKVFGARSMAVATGRRPACGAGVLCALLVLVMPARVAAQNPSPPPTPPPPSEAVASGKASGSNEAAKVLAKAKSPAKPQTGVSPKAPPKVKV